MISLSILAASPCRATDLVVNKNIVSYIVTLDSISPGYLLKGSGAKATVELTITPKSRAKYAPKVITMYANNIAFPIDIDSYSGPGTYTTTLDEGIDLMDVAQYAVYITVDNAQSNVKNVTVFDFDGKLKPDDLFDANRNMEKYGIAETVQLSASLSPSGVSATDIGGLEWVINSGVGSLSNGTNNGTASFNAGETPGNTQLQLDIVSGQFQGQSKTYNKTVIKPSGAYMVQSLQNTNVMHVFNTASVGFLGYTYLLPKDVSFTKIQTREGTASASASGFLAPLNNLSHPVGIWAPINNCSLTTGCQEMTEDAVGLLPHNGPYVGEGQDGGSFLWQIPWQYHVGTGDAVSYYNAIHSVTVDVTGRSCTRKAGSAEYCKGAGEATSGSEILDIMMQRGY